MIALVISTECVASLADSLKATLIEFVYSPCVMNKGHTCISIKSCFDCPSMLISAITDGVHRLHHFIKFGSRNESAGGGGGVHM